MQHVLVPHALGSRTSGVDGSSEGGRINTNNLPGALVLYGVALLQELQRLELSYTGDAPAAVPNQWHGHRVILKKLEPPPSA
jgi:hypothetical protein